MENGTIQETLYSLLKSLLPIKEKNGTYSHKYRECSIIDEVASKIHTVYKNSTEEERNYIYYLINFRIKELYCSLGEYDKALNFNKSFSDQILSYWEKNQITEYDFPYIINEAISQLKINNCFGERFFNIINGIFSSELIKKINITPPAYSFDLNGEWIYMGFKEEDLFNVYLNYLKKTLQNNDVKKVDEGLCFLFGIVLDWISTYYCEEVIEIVQELKDLIIEIGMPLNDNKNYFITFAQYYLDVETLKFVYANKFDQEEGSFRKLNKNESKELKSRLSKFVHHILSMKKDFTDSDYYSITKNIIQFSSVFCEDKNVFIECFIENLKICSPINEIIDLIIDENINILFELQKYDLIVDYYKRNSNVNVINYNLFEIAYSLYKQKCFDESKRVYEYIINHGDGTGAVYNNLSLIYEEQGDFNKAQKLLNIALEIENDDKIARKNLNRINDKVKKQNQVQQIKNAYSKSGSSVEFESLPFKTKVYLGALCRELLSENLYEIKPNIEAQNPITPTDKLLGILYNDLISNRVLSVSPRSPVEAFSQEDDFPNTYYTYKVIYNLNLSLPPNKQDLIDNILNPKYYSDEFSETAYELWKEIAIEECIEYLLHQLNLVGFQGFKPGDKTNIMINTLIETFSVGQVYGIIYKSVANASKLYLEKGMPKAQAANTVIGGCQRLGENALINNWDMSQYSRIKKLPQSVFELHPKS